LQQRVASLQQQQEQLEQQEQQQQQQQQQQPLHVSVVADANQQSVDSERPHQASAQQTDASRIARLLKLQASAPLSSASANKTTATSLRRAASQLVTAFNRVVVDGKVVLAADHPSRAKSFAVRTTSSSAWAAGVRGGDSRGLATPVTTAARRHSSSIAMRAVSISSSSEEEEVMEDQIRGRTSSGSGGGAPDRRLQSSSNAAPVSSNKTLSRAASAAAALSGGYDVDAFRRSLSLRSLPSSQQQAQQGESAAATTTSSSPGPTSISRQQSTSKNGEAGGVRRSMSSSSRVASGTERMAARAVAPSLQPQQHRQMQQMVSFQEPAAVRVPLLRRSLTAAEARALQKLKGLVVASSSDDSD